MKTLLIGLLAILSLSAFAKEGGNGGDAVVTSDNAIRLRDLVDPGNCTWKSGKSILDQKDLSSILDKLMDANPHFAYKLQEQILKIKWCYTATLKKIETNDDEETLTYYLDPYAQTKTQAGIRVINNVYIDRSILAPNLLDGRLAKEDHPYFYLHEAMHAFLYMKTPNRNKRVRDAVKAIKDFIVGDTNADDLDAMIAGSDLLTLKMDSPIQNLAKVLIESSLTVEERVQIAKPILSPELKNDLLVQQWKDIETLFSDEELTVLTNKTGLTRFEFMKRTRGNILVEPLKKPRFINDFNLSLVDNIDFGKCSSKVYNLYKPVGIYDDGGWYSYSDDLYYWLRVADIKTGITIMTSGRQDKGFSRRDQKTVYRYNPKLATELIMNNFFYESMCDFTPEK